MINYSYRSSGWRDILTNVGGVSYSSDAIGTQDYYYIRNAQGDITGIADIYGNVVVAYTYSAWGQILSVTGSAESSLGQWNPLRYRGYVYDGETGYYYLQSRYYDPANGRFLNADVYIFTGQGFIGNNIFVYCLNNPVNLFDKKGKDAGTIAAEWGASMWWLTLVDGPLPIGDRLYYGGLLVLGGLALTGLDYLASSPPIVFAAEEPELPDVEYPGG